MPRHHFWIFRMTRRALSRRVISWLGNVWPDLACHGGRPTPIFPSTWDSILNISQNLPYQINWSRCGIYTLRYCPSARFKENSIEWSEISKFNDYCPPTWVRKFSTKWWKMMFFKRSQYRFRSILAVILGCLGIIFEDRQLKKRPKW